ncbi:MAG: type IV secretory system conjugative DNA transfer family protein [Candidatus Marsarchaeota archaeon]|nr:type IV secretory system conjugative DNA transfer family protein [Candidatus Marsarchaeota archaeon]
MKRRMVSGIEFVSDLIRLPEAHVQEKARMLEGARDGLFVGMSHRVPYFLDIGAAINPHVFICGITGSGKTYLMRNLALKLDKICGAKVVLLDFTGEYEEFARLMGTNPIGHDGFEEGLDGESGTLYVNLKTAGDEMQRVRLAGMLLATILKRMRLADCAHKTFVVLDESWKLLKEDRSLNTLLREGRKYGYGLVFSSQLVEDVDLAMLSNAATLFIFRLQNRKGLERLAGNYKLAERHLQAIQKLGVGSCVVIQTEKSGRRSFCIVDRTHGVEVEDEVLLYCGEGMRLEIERKRLEDALCAACGREAAWEALRECGQEGRIELPRLVESLIRRCRNRADVLSALRELGIAEGAIADSFALAVRSIEGG